jgi:hypothetical protein
MPQLVRHVSKIEFLFSGFAIYFQFLFRSHGLKFSQLAFMYSCIAGLVSLKIKKKCS